MPSQSPRSDQDEQFRDDHPSGWFVLARNGSVVRIIDALLDLPAKREFNQSELAEIAGVSRQSVNAHLDLLLEAGVIESVAHSQNRYRFDPKSDVSEALIRLDGAMNAAGAGP